MPTLGRMLAIAAALVTIVALSLSITASASAAPTDEEPERVLVAEGVMTFIPDVAAGEVTTYNQAVGNCGTSAIYISSPSKGKAVVTWSLHSTSGTMIHRDLTINHGPAKPGQIIDKGVFARLD